MRFLKTWKVDKRLKAKSPQRPGQKLAKALREREAEKWLRRNGPALEAYNEHIEKHGVFSESLRSF